MTMIARTHTNARFEATAHKLMTTHNVQKSMHDTVNSEYEDTRDVQKSAANTV